MAVTAKRTFGTGRRYSGGVPGNFGGFTLVELMVAMLVFLLLIGAVMQLFAQSRESYRLQEGLARAQENGRLGVLFIERHLLRTAYPQDALPLYNGFSRSKLTTSLAFTGDASAPANATSDTLMIQLQSPDGGVDDCTGRNVPADDYVAMYFFLDGDTLTCESIIDSDTARRSAPLIDGISGMQFTYAVDEDKDGEPDGTFVDAGVTELNEDGEWETVIAVNIEITTAAVEPVKLSGGRQLSFSGTVPIRNQVNRE